jgi:hypothetical protein
VELVPLTGWVVRASQASRVVVPPSDGLSATARRALAATAGARYLGALPPGPAASDAVREEDLARCRAHLERLFAEDRYQPVADVLLVIASDRQGRRRVAVVGDVPVAAFRDGRIRPHEATDPARVDDLARYAEVVGVASSPVAVVHRPSPARDAAVAEVRRGTPTRTLRDPARQETVTVWVVTRTTDVARLRDAVAGVGPGELADGHHRAAAAATLAARDGAPDSGHVLTALCSDEDLAIEPFHRRVDLGGDLAPIGDRLRADPGTDGLRELTTSTPWDVPRAGTWHVAVDGRWFRRDEDGEQAADATGVAGDDPRAVLDVVRAGRWLTDHLGVPAARLRAVPPGAAGSLAAPGVLGVALHPPSWDQVRAVTATGATLPAKSTYVTPKLRSGIVVVARDHRRPL